MSETPEKTLWMGVREGEFSKGPRKVSTPVMKSLLEFNSYLAAFKFIDNIYFLEN